MYMSYNVHHSLSVRYSQSEHFVVRFILSKFYHPPSAWEDVNKYYSVRYCPAHEVFGSVYAVVTAESGVNVPRIIDDASRVVPPESR